MKWKTIEIHTLWKKKKIRKDEKGITFFFVPWWIVIFRIKLQTSNKLKKTATYFFTWSKHSNTFLDTINKFLKLVSKVLYLYYHLIYVISRFKKRNITFSCFLTFNSWFQHKNRNIGNYCGGRNRDRHPTRCEYSDARSY